MRIALGVASGGMEHANDTARAILNALLEAHSADKTPQAIILDETTRECLQRAGLGYWSAGPATWSLFNVPVVVGPVAGWRLRVVPEADAGEDPGSGTP
jgi:hypothetical protein